MPPEGGALQPSAAAAALAEAERVLERQKACAARSTGLVYKLLHAVEAVHVGLAADPAPGAPAAALADLAAQLDALGAGAALAAETKALHGAVARLGKALDGGFDGDAAAAALAGAPPLDAAALDRAVAEHLFREGQFAVGDAFAAEAALPDAAALKAPYAAMHAALERLRAHDLGPARAWAAAHAAALRGGARGAPPSDLEFRLERLAFLQALRAGGHAAALALARERLAPFAATHLKELQRLAGALVYSPVAGGAPPAGAPPPPPPYAELLGDAAPLWEAAARDFVRHSCALLGQAADPPLLVAVAAGAAALPTLQKLAAVVAAAPPGAGRDSLAGGFAAGGQLPVELPIGDEFAFRSVFACPVSREESGPGNPPMMLPCGHCICRQSVLRLARGVARAFKCPYCPAEASLAACVELRFPDAG
jgi:hypothetical protein